MTGFGSAHGKLGSGQVFVEARSVNHRYLEVHSRLPHRLAGVEGDATRLVRSLFNRGKIDIFVREGSSSKDQWELVLFRESHRFLQQVRSRLKIKQEITVADLLAFREIFLARRSGEDLEKVKAVFLRLVKEALKKLEQMRAREGGHLARWFESRLTHLNRLIGLIERQVKTSVERNRQKVELRFKDLGVHDQERMAQEVGSLTDRSDVTEEIIRLQSHLKEFLRIMKLHEPVGRKLDFLSQEMGREINTIGAKSQGVKVAHQVVEFKSELEKIREQVQNIE